MNVSYSKILIAGKSCNLNYSATKLHPVKGHTIQNEADTSSTDKGSHVVQNFVCMLWVHMGQTLYLSQPSECLRILVLL